MKACVRLADSQTVGSPADESRPDPYLYPPRDADFFDRFASVEVAAGAEELLAEIAFRPGEKGSLTGIGMEILDDPAGTALSGFSDVVWSLRINGIPHRDYGDIRDQIGRGDTLRDIRVKLTSDVIVIGLYVTNNGVVNYVCFAGVQGYSFRT